VSFDVSGELFQEILSWSPVKLERTPIPEFEIEEGYTQGIR
jgi:hypothetical protein